MSENTNQNIKEINNKLIILIMMITMSLVYLILFGLWYFTGPEDNKPSDFLIDNEKQGYTSNPLEDRLKIPKDQ